MYVTVFFGTMTFGSAIWGDLASFIGLAFTHFLAAAGALAAIPLTSRWKLHTDVELDLTPSMHWPAPVVSDGIVTDAGPMMVTVQYRIEAENREAFLIALEKLGHERKRDGAYAWDIFQDTSDEELFVEIFFLESRLEHLRQHSRVTEADRTLEQNVAQYLRLPPAVTHYVAAEVGKNAIASA